MPVLDSPNSINNRAMADRLAATLGDWLAAMMKSHGAVTVGKDIVEAFVLAPRAQDNVVLPATDRRSVGALSGRVALPAAVHEGESRSVGA